MCRNELDLDMARIVWEGGGSLVKLEKMKEGIIDLDGKLVKSEALVFLPRVFMWDIYVFGSP